MDLSDGAATDWKVSPRRLLVAFPEGGSTHFTATRLAECFAATFGHEVAVEVHSGDDGLDAVRALASAPAAETLLVGNINANSVLPVVREGSLGIDYAGALRPVTRLAEFPSVVMTGPDSPAATLREFLDGIASSRRPLRYGTDFLGTYVDYDVLALAQASGLSAAYRTTNGAVGILNDLVAGAIDLALLNVATASANRGRYVPLAVTSSSRLSRFPDVPTMAEAGFSGIGTSNWQGLFAARSLPLEAVAQLFSTARSAVESAPFGQALHEVDAEPAPSASPEAFEQEIGAEMARWAGNLPQILALPKADAANGETP